MSVANSCAFITVKLLSSPESPLSRWVWLVFSISRVLPICRSSNALDFSGLESTKSGSKNSAACRASMLWPLFKSPIASTPTEIVSIFSLFKASSNQARVSMVFPSLMSMVTTERPHSEVLGKLVLVFLERTPFLISSGERLILVLDMKALSQSVTGVLASVMLHFSISPFMQSISGFFFF